MIFKNIYKKLCIKKAKKICSICGSYIIGSVLDVGSGRSYIAKEIAQMGNRVQCPNIKDHNLTACS